MKPTTPNPTSLTELLDIEAVSYHRKLLCPEYDDCLCVAAGSGWTSFSCEHCPLARGKTALPEHLLMTIEPMQA